ncbi:hypothetical protein N7533_008323 [Penicillium manginii]|uniref:uncharacterized protein n=1 Tax=Penicillium manginii TaxID=203109 RepID=UPI002547A7E3|nr:uncharacterized protein N7533_008323 [Penicillium manginii]KAJ5751295.1 hypothetical protein N7533_008323 [Penicillium manginii]
MTKGTTSSSNNGKTTKASVSSGSGGDPGKGKTMLLCGIIDELTQSIGVNANISFFFCQSTDVRINNATAVLRGLIYSLVEKRPSLLSHVRSRYDQAGKTLFEDINAWNALSKIFTDILRDSTLQNTYLVIDALDECAIDLPFLLDLIVQESCTHSHVKWIVSSRNWPDIEEHLDTATQIAPISLELNEVSVSEAVKKFIQHKVQKLVTDKGYNDKIRDMVYYHLLSHSQGTFLWVALVCQDLNRTSRRHVLKKLKDLPPGLNALYSRMIDQVRKSEDAELCKQILATMSIVYRPITLDELTALVKIPNDVSGDHKDLLEIIAICGSFLTLREETIVFVHQSAKEFLLEKARIELFPGDKEAAHLAIFARSLQTIFKTLRRNILGVANLGTSTKEFIQLSPNPLAAVKYACEYWIDHLQEGWSGKVKDHSLNNGGCVDRFLRQNYLHWLESLGILGSVPQGIKAMLKLEELLQKRGKSEALLDRVQDASRFIRYYSQGIESSPLQVYSSGLIFSPTRCITRTCYQKEKSDWILNSPVIGESWSLCLQTLEGHSSSVTSIAWSPNGSRLTSASDDNTVKIWEPTTGQCTFTLEGHVSLVISITWSPDGSRIASASHDNTARIWDPVTGQCISILEGHSGLVRSIFWSPEGSRIASASHDNTAWIWDPVTGQCISILEGHGSSVTSIAWSPNGSRLTSASDDNTVKIWDPTTGQCIFTFEGHSSLVISIPWSPDGSRLALASHDNTARIWDPVTGQCISILEGHSRVVSSIVWSPEGSRLASASYDKTVRIWDSATGQCTSTLEGHSRSVSLIAWSPDANRLASVSYDNTIRIWDSATGQCIYILEGHSSLVSSIVWSPEGSRLASASYDKTVRIWDSASSQYTSTLQEYSSRVISIVWSPDGSQLASASDDNIVRTWDPATGQCTITLKGHSSSVTSIVWSPEGSRLTSASGDNTVKIWDPTTGKCIFTLEGHSSLVISTTWSPDGSRLASASHDNTARIWDPATGQCISILQGHSNWVISITWSPDRSRLASASHDNTARIWDPTTGQCISILEGHSNWVISIAWSPDGSRLASASGDNTVKIWDPTTGQCTSTLEGHSSSVTSIAWSPDGSRHASASDDNTVRIWDSATGQCTFTFNVCAFNFNDNFPRQSVQFNRTMPNHLHTNVGTFNLGSPDPVASSPCHFTLPGKYGYGLGDGASWITYNGFNLLWLPAEYRPSKPSLFAISETTVAIGCSSGRVIFLALSE